MTYLRMRPWTWARGAVSAQSQGRVRSAVNRLRLAVGIALVVLVTAPAHASGQLELIPNPPTLIVLIIGFVILIAPLNAMIFRPLFRVLDERDAKIAGATEEAGQLVTRAAELTEEYRGAIREAREAAEGARKQQLESARAEHASITGDARTESEGEISRARDEIEAGLVEARATLEATSRDLAKVAAERILGRPLQ